MASVQSNQGPRAFVRGAAVLAAACATAAVAQPTSQIDVNAGATAITKVTAVQTHDLNLSSEQGRRKLDHRIRIAAAKVCDVWDISWQRPLADYTRCYTTALEKGRAQAAERSARNDGSPIRVS